nr:MAG TPA: hypothetical protein [Ackermannviridae sp.]
MRIAPPPNEWYSVDNEASRTKTGGQSNDED